MAKIKATRLLKVRDALTALVQIPDLPEGEQPKAFEDLSTDDQAAVMQFSKASINLVDALLDRSVKVNIKVDGKAVGREVARHMRGDK
jgi:hypothetical protein